MKYLLLIFGLLSFNCSADEPYAFKGWKLDENISNLDISELSCVKTHSVHIVLGDIQCVEKGYKSKLTIAETPVKFISFNFFNDLLSFINIKVEERYFSQIRDAFIEKYGKPTSEENSVIQNRAGASFDNSVLQWENSVSFIKLEKRSGQVDSSYISFRSKNGLFELEKRSKEKASSGSHDL